MIFNNYVLLHSRFWSVFTSRARRTPASLFSLVLIQALARGKYRSWRLTARYKAQRSPHTLTLATQTHSTIVLRMHTAMKVCTGSFSEINYKY